MRPHTSLPYLSPVLTLDDALNELGIDREADAEGARRAYLRLLKKRKPEVDPEGFMRLREAYELAKPYFEQIDVFRAIEKAAQTDSAGANDPGDLIRVETPAGIVWLQKNRPLETQPDQPVPQDKPAEVSPDEPVVASSDPPKEQSLPFDEKLPEVATPAIAEPSAETEASKSSSPYRTVEPSIEELLAAGKFKAAGRRMGRAYRAAMEMGTIGVNVPAPHSAVLLILRLNEKNFLPEARALDEDFAAWLASTGESVRIMAGPMGVTWLLARELSALPNSFPSELRKDIAKAIAARKIEDAQRQAAIFQIGEERKARDAALALHAHAPTLAKFFVNALNPPEPRQTSIPVRGGNSGSWGIGIVLVMCLNLFRVCESNPRDPTTSYQGQADRSPFYRPKPARFDDDFNAPPNAETAKTAPVVADVKIDNGTRDKLIKLTKSIEAAAEKATKNEERFSIIRRIRYIRSAIESGSCDRASAEINGFSKEVQDAPNPLRETLASDVKKLETTYSSACVKKNLDQTLQDVGLKKP